ncbi:MAG: thioredoxin domain-containing protein [Bacteroidales bacterium]|nr:thioredoxin domain-containing protein [Bacteroidales bacterium]
MNKLLIIIFIAVWSTATAQQTSFKQVNAQEFYRLATTGKGMILDVRTKSEFDNEHIANSQYLNFYALDFKKKLLMLPKDEEIYLYCTTGYRSEKAAKYLAKNGYTKVYNLEHGILEWNLENLPVIEGEPSAKLMADKVSPELFEQSISSDTLVLVDFYATWCGPCRKMMPLIDSIRTQYHPALKVFKVNVDVSKKLIKQEKIIGVPFFRIYRKGKVLFEKDGMLSRKELEAIIEELLKEKMP